MYTNSVPLEIVNEFDSQIENRPLEKYSKNVAKGQGNIAWVANVKFIGYMPIQVGIVPIKVTDPAHHFSIVAEVEHFHAKKYFTIADVNQ